MSPGDTVIFTYRMPVHYYDQHSRTKPRTVYETQDIEVVFVKFVGTMARVRFTSAAVPYERAVKLSTIRGK